MGNAESRAVEEEKTKTIELTNVSFSDMMKNISDNPISGPSENYKTYKLNIDDTSKSNIEDTEKFLSESNDITPTKEEINEFTTHFSTKSFWDDLDSEKVTNVIKPFVESRTDNEIKTLTEQKLVTKELVRSDEELMNIITDIVLEIQEDAADFNPVKFKKIIDTIKLKIVQHKSTNRSVPTLRNYIITRVTEKGGLTNWVASITKNSKKLANPKKYDPSLDIIPEYFSSQLDTSDITMLLMNDDILDYILSLIIFIENGGNPWLASVFFGLTMSGCYKLTENGYTKLTGCVDITSSNLSSCSCTNIKNCDSSAVDCLPITTDGKFVNYTYKYFSPLSFIPIGMSINSCLIDYFYEDVPDPINWVLVITIVLIIILAFFLIIGIIKQNNQK